MTSALRFAMLAGALMTACTNDGYLPREPRDSSPILATLYAHDPLRDSYDFDQADYAHFFQDGQIKSRVSQITYEKYGSDGLSVGIEPGETGTILDLGTDAELANRIGVSETGSGGQGFAALTLDGETFNDPTASALFTTQPTVAASSAVVDGHVYVLRLVRAPYERDLRVKLLVIGHNPGNFVAFEWLRLP